MNDIQRPKPNNSKTSLKKGDISIPYNRTSKEKSTTETDQNHNPTMTGIST